MARFTIRCPSCRGTKTGQTKHGFKLFALMHGIRCDAKHFNVTTQTVLSDWTGEGESDA